MSNWKIIVIIGCCLALTAIMITILFSIYISIHTSDRNLLYPEPPRYEVIEIFYNKTGYVEKIYSYTGAVRAKIFEVRIESFSKELILMYGDEVIKPSYMYRDVSRKPESRPVYFYFKIIAPAKPGEYTINLRYKVSNGLLYTREYYQEILVKVVKMPYKPRPEEILAIGIDRNMYRPGETMIITIKNISNETIWFTNTVYNIVFERFNSIYNDWIYHTSPIAGQALVSISPNEEKQVKYIIDPELFPPGLYRVGTHGVYIEFEVVSK